MTTGGGADADATTLFSDVSLGSGGFNSPQQQQQQQQQHPTAAAHADGSSSRKAARPPVSVSISAPPPPPLAALRAVCAAHALARWAWRTWEFAVALILIRLSPASLALVSAYGLADNVARVAFGAAAGAYVDREERLRGACACVLLQNACILASALAAGALLLAGGGSSGGGAPPGPDSAAAAAAAAGAAAAAAAGPHPALFWPLIAVVVGAGAMSSVGSTGAAAAVEREWVKALCGDDAPLLARVNSGAAAAPPLCWRCQRRTPRCAPFLLLVRNSLALPWPLSPLSFPSKRSPHFCPLSFPPHRCSHARH